MNPHEMSSYDQRPVLIVFVWQHSEKGLLSMANCGVPNSNNSQFSITLNEAMHLDHSYCVFGRVVKGFQIINLISYQVLDPESRPVPVSILLLGNYL